MFSDQEELVLAGLTELSERLLEARQQIYRLKNEVERLRRFELAVTSTAKYRRTASSVLAAITWAEDLEEARDLAARALVGEDVHVPPPDSDKSSISETASTSKGEQS